MSSAVAGPSRGGAPGGGGGQGRGRGRGGFGGGGAAGRQVNMGNMTMSDLMDVQAMHGTGRHAGRVPYPPMEAAPEVSPGSAAENAAVEATLDFMRAQRATPWWVREAGSEEANAAIHSASAAASGDAAGTATAAAALIRSSVKRGASDVLRYSDRKRLREAAEQAAAAENAAALDASTTQFPLTLNDKSAIKLLHRESFPMDLWRTYMQRETRRQERMEGAKRRKGGKGGNWKDLMAQMEGNMAGGDGGPLNDDGSDAGGSEEDEEAVAADEYEDDEDDDYADNYFDNGEEDDAVDLGGGEGEADYD